jgi:hypothetical protein
MRNLLFICVLALLCPGLYAQKTPVIWKIPADSVLLSYCDSTELIIENHTQTVSGFLFNNGRGRTIFKRGAQKLNDSLYLIGADTVRIASKPWIQGGNRFAATGVLGTLDSNALDLYTNNTQKVRLTTSGDLLIGSSLDSGYKLDVKGTAFIGKYDGYNTIRGNLNFDNNGHNSYITEQGTLGRSIVIPGNGGNAPWIFNNLANQGIEVADQAGTVFLQGGKIQVRSTNFANNVGFVVGTEPSAPNNRVIYFGTTSMAYLNENGVQIAINAGPGGSFTNGPYGGGSVSINPGEQGAIGPKGNILLGNQVYGNVGVQTGAPVSNFEVDQGTSGSGVVANDAGGTTVRGTSTQFTNTFKVGDSITIAGQTVTITAVTSDTRMTTTPITNADSNANYTLSGGRRFHVKGNGTVGIGTSTPASQLDILGFKGYSQLRMRTPYTPSSSSDTNGNVGDMAWDENYIYVKTASGWKRSTLGTF